MMPTRRSINRPTDTVDHGLSLIELLVIIVILGILATIVAFGVGSIRAEAAESTCNADEQILWTAVESYFNQSETDTIPATGIDHDRYERTLTVAGFLPMTSDQHDLDATGATTPRGSSPC